MRVLVTGSRDWLSWVTVWEAIDTAVFTVPQPRLITVVHGNCPRGADRFAQDWCENLAGALEDEYGVRVTEERHPADWKRHGKRAGFLRNAEMVNLGADVCLAFIRNNSRGASMTADLAQRAGIKTIIYREV